MPEVKNRISSAKSAMFELRPKVFTAGPLSLALKIQLSQSLIESRLFYGAQTWPDLRPNELQALHTFRTMVFRAASGLSNAGLAKELRVTDAFVWQTVQQPSTSTHIRAARL
eukprot:1971119-Lingulodinium_polyedra.AAC.1